MEVCAIIYFYNRDLSNVFHVIAMFMSESFMHVCVQKSLPQLP